MKGIIHKSDDLIFSQEAQHANVINWLIIRYHGWSSRTAIEFALITLINNKITWSLFNSFFIAITISCVAYITSRFSREAIISSVVFLLVLIFTLKKDVLKDGVIWMTGSFNYLWPVALSLFGFALIKALPLVKNTMPLYIAAFVFFFLSSFSEQVVAVNLILLTTLAFIYTGNIRKISICSLIATILVFVYIITCPGNKARLFLEIPRWNPDFVNTTIFDKVILGINMSFDQIFSIQPLAWVILYASLMVCSMLKFAKITSAIMLSIILLIMALNRFSDLTHDYTAVLHFNSDSVSGAISIVRAVVVLAMAALTIFILFMSLRNNKEKYVAVFYYISSFAGTVMLGLSPTIYASSDRIFFVSSVMVSVLAAYFATQAINRHIEVTR
ncbi:hypothetical protein GRH90_04130 [Enterobacteriales bacterium SAP-6]|uniref:Uncharacterized protein n=2 Tax=Acerihabitans arboris TaxID=2691583 RepID=A0A845SEW7_9GAMM|nr:hypothetical protein [Acerihabitans arboris]